MRSTLLPALGIKPVDLIAGWWHADDIETALEMLGEFVEAHGLAGAVPEERIRADHAAAMDAQTATEHDLEDDQRAHQIGATAVAANELLAARGDAKRFRAFDRALAAETSDEPAWLLVTPDEHAKLRAGSGPLDPLDQIYDDARSVAGLPPIAWPAGAIPVAQLSAADAGTRAYKAFWEHRHADALALFPAAVTDVRSAYLSEVLWIDTLIAVDDHAAASARWTVTVDRWLRERSWDSHWERLEAQYTILGLSDATRIAALRARKPGAVVAGPVELGTGTFDEEVLLGVGAMWFVYTGLALHRGDHVLYGDHDIVIPEDITTDHRKRRTGIRILDDRPAPAKGTTLRFVR